MSKTSSLITFAIICVLLLQITPSNGNFHMVHDNPHLPCHFLDTVNITGSLKFDNGSYLHDNVIIPAPLVGTYDFQIVMGLEKIPAEPHLRGCICKLKPCIKFCCPPDKIYNANVSGCTSSEELNYSPEIEIKLKNDSVLTFDVIKSFALQIGTPCNDMFFLTPQWADYDKWELFENGTLLRVDDQVHMYKDEYCIAPQKINAYDTVYVLNPMNCLTQQDSASREIIYAYSMMFSIPFMVITIVVYLLIPELRNQHGKSLSCYLLGLIVGYSSLSYVSMSNPSELDQLTCTVLGHIAYFSFLTSFFWLSVISFDLWRSFCGTQGINRFLEKKRLFIYSSYAWGLPIIFLFFTLYAERSSRIPIEIKPGIGGDYCFLDMRGWQALIYFYGPIMIIIIVDITMFILTAMKIHRVQKEMSRIMARDDSAKNMRSETDRFGLFVRLFIIMGVTWSLEIISFFVGNDSKWSKIFYISDICNAIQGFLIFSLFVMKKKVKQLIISRILKKKMTTDSSQSPPSTSDEISDPISLKTFNGI